MAFVILIQSNGEFTLAAEHIATTNADTTLKSLGRNAEHQMMSWFRGNCATVKAFRLR